MKSAFEHKPELRLSEFVIEKTVRISDESFERMLRRPMDGRPFIAENIDLMYQDDDDVFHCILVTGENRTDGILVESEGYGYARYASYIPEISALGYPSLAAWNRKLMSAADLIVEAGINRSESSKWRLTYEELEKVVTIIESMISQVEHQNVTVNETAGSFRTIEDNSGRVQSQSDALSGIVKELESANAGIMDSIQTISAISEEVAAHTNNTLTTCEKNQKSVEHLMAETENLIELTHQLQQ